MNIEIGSLVAASPRGETFGPCVVLRQLDPDSVLVQDLGGHSRGIVAIVSCWPIEGINWEFLGAADALLGCDECGSFVDCSIDALERVYCPAHRFLHT